MHLLLQAARHITVDGLHGNVGIGLQVADCTDIMIRNVDVEIRFDHQSSGRAISMWNTQRFIIDGLRVYGKNLPPRTSRGVMIESHCFDGVIDKAQFTFDMVGRSWGDTVGVYHITGGSDRISIPYTKIIDPSLIDLWSTGGIVNPMPNFGVVHGIGNTSLLKQYVNNGMYKIRRLIAE
jgi:hypothetical protein